MVASSDVPGGGGYEYIRYKKSDWDATREFVFLAWLPSVNICLPGEQSVVCLIQKYCRQSKPGATAEVLADGISISDRFSKAVIEIGIDHADAIAKKRIHFFGIGEQSIRNPRMRTPGTAKLRDLFFDRHLSEQLPDIIFYYTSALLC
jgi:hypothetical protein